MEHHDHQSHNTQEIGIKVIEPLRMTMDRYVQSGKNSCLWPTRPRKHIFT